jgi:hypothetical protein
MKTLGLVLCVAVAVAAIGLTVRQALQQAASQNADLRETTVPAAVNEATSPGDEREAKVRAALAAGRPAIAPATAPAKLIWRGLDLSAAPVSPISAYPWDIWEERPAGSGSYEVRADVTVIPPQRYEVFNAGTIYWLRSANRFYVHYHPVSASTTYVYGPFEGDPNQVLTPPTSRPNSMLLTPASRG